MPRNRNNFCTKLCTLWLVSSASPFPANSDTCRSTRGKCSPRGLHPENDQDALRDRSSALRRPCRWKCRRPSGRARQPLVRQLLCALLHLHLTAPYCTLLNLTAPYCTLLYLTAPYCTCIFGCMAAPYCTLLYLTAPYCTFTVPYCTLLHLTVP